MRLYVCFVLETFEAGYWSATTICTLAKPSSSSPTSTNADTREARNVRPSLYAEKQGVREGGNLFMFGLK